MASESPFTAESSSLWVLFFPLEWAGRLSGSNQMLDKGHNCVEQCGNMQASTTAIQKKYNCFSLGIYLVYDGEVYLFFAQVFVKTYLILLTEGIKQ